jgi:hypothetical protein
MALPVPGHSTLALTHRLEGSGMLSSVDVAATGTVALRPRLRMEIQFYFPRIIAHFEQE